MRRILQLASLRPGDFRRSAAILREALARDPILRSAAFMLLAAATGLIAIHVAFGLWELLGNRFAARWWRVETGLSLTKEGSVPELAEYAALLAAAAILAMVWWRRRAPIHAALSGISLWLLADNAGALHERLGMVLNPQDGQTGEIMYFAVVAPVLAIWGVLAMRASPHADRVAALPSMVSLAGIAIAAVVVDGVHAKLGGSGVATELVAGTLEDGGEMFFIACNLACALALLRSMPEIADRTLQGSPEPLACA